LKRYGEGNFLLQDQTASAADNKDKFLLKVFFGEYQSKLKFSKQMKNVHHQFHWNHF